MNAPSTTKNASRARFRRKAIAFRKKWVCPPLPVPEELRKLVKRRPSKAGPYLMTQVAVRRGGTRWEVVDQNGLVLFASRQLIMANVVMCICGLIKGKLLTTGKPRTLPASPTFCVHFSEDGFTARFPCQPESEMPLYTAGFVMLSDTGRTTAYYPNIELPTHEPPQTEPA